MGNKTSKNKKQYNLTAIYDQSGNNIMGGMFLPATITPRYLKRVWSQSNFLKENEYVESITLCFENDERYTFDRGKAIKLNKKYKVT